MGRKRAKNPFLLQTTLFHLHLHLLRLSLSLSRQEHETEKDACERCIQRGEKHPAMKVRRLLTAVTNVAQKTTRCLENGGLAYRTTAPTFFWDSIKAVAEAEVPGGERTSSDTPPRDQSRWAESSTTAETPRVRSSRAQLARAARSTTSQRPNREAWRTSSASQAARKESGTRFLGEPTRSSQSHMPVPGALSAAPTLLVSQCAKSVVDGALDELMALHEEFLAGRNVEENASVEIAKAKVKHMRSQSRIGCSPSSECVPVSGLRLVKISSVKPTVGVTRGLTEIFDLDRLHSRSNMKKHGCATFLWISAIQLLLCRLRHGQPRDHRELAPPSVPARAQSLRWSSRNAGSLSLSTGRGCRPSRR